jgi:hypothetical protein
MKLFTTLVLLGFLLCGCSQSHGAPPRSALDRVVAGKNISFGGDTLYVEKREGASVEGVRIVSRKTGGETTTTTAKKGTVSQGADRSAIVIVLRDAQVEKGGQKATFAELPITLVAPGL